MSPSMGLSSITLKNKHPLLIISLHLYFFNDQNGELLFLFQS